MHNHTLQPRQSSTPVVAFDPAGEFAAWQLIATMGWPKDKRRQAHVLTTHAADLMGLLEDVVPLAERVGARQAAEVLARAASTDPDSVRFFPWKYRHYERLMDSPEAAFREVARTVFKPNGGFKSVADAPGTERILQELRAATLGGAGYAGSILVYVARMAVRHADLEPSVARAIAMMMELRRRHPERGIPSDRVLKDAWTEWRDVAPLWAGLITASDVRADAPAGPLPTDLAILDVLLTPEGRVVLLAHAAWFRAFAAESRHRNAKGPLIPEDEVVELQCGVEPIEPPFKDLPAWAVEAVRSRRQGGSYHWNPLDRD